MNGNFVRIVELHHEQFLHAIGIQFQGSLIRRAFSFAGMDLAMETEATRFYQPNDEVMKAIAAKQKLAQWRNEQRMLPYHQVGSRILYKGSDLLKLIESNRVEPIAA
jgi:hypothetical protein